MRLYYLNSRRFIFYFLFQINNLRLLNSFEDRRSRSPINLPADPRIRLSAGDLNCWRVAVKSRDGVFSDPILWLYLSFERLKTLILNVYLSALLICWVWLLEGSQGTLSERKISLGYVTDQPPSSQDGPGTCGVLDCVELFAGIFLNSMMLTSRELVIRSTDEMKFEGWRTTEEAKSKICFELSRFTSFISFRSYFKCCVGFV